MKAFDTPETKEMLGNIKPSLVGDNFKYEFFLKHQAIFNYGIFIK